MIFFLFQFFSATEQPLDLSSEFNTTKIVFAVGGIAMFAGILWFVRWIWRTIVLHPQERKYSFSMAVLLVTLPKESPQDKQKEITQDKIREQIAVAETLMTTVASLVHHYRWWAPSKPLSFEIVAHKKVISFYVSTPRHLQQAVEQHIHAQYPMANIEEVPDYNMFEPHGLISGGYLRAVHEVFFPFKTFRTLDSDPLNAITNVLSKLTEHEGAAVQITFVPASHRWRTKGRLLIREMQKGTHLAEALKRSQRSILWKAIRDVGSIFKSPQAQDPQQQIPKSSPREEEMMKAIEEKLSKVGLIANVRLVVCSSTMDRAESQLENMMSAFSQYTIYEYGNAYQLKRPRTLDTFVEDFIYRQFRPSQSVTITSEEFASIIHFPLPMTETPNIRWLAARKAPPPVNLPQHGIALGEAVFRGQTTLVRILPEDRRRHIYIIGRSGVGKSVLQTNMAVQDIVNGDGVCVIDPHGDLVDDIIVRIPPERAEDVVYFNPSDVERPMGLNLLEYDPKYPEQKTFVINEMIKIFDKLYDLRQTGGPMFEQYMRNAMLLVMEDPESGSTLMEIPKVLADKAFRSYKISRCNNPVVKDFWVKEAEKAGGEASLANMVPYITSKLTQFVANDLMRPIIAQQKSAFNIREIMDQKKIFLVNLSKGRLGDINAYLVGMILVGKILMASLSRTDIPQDQRSDFYLYIDEFQNFITDSISTILSEARKYRLDLVIAHQYMGQLIEKQETKIRDAVLGNAGTMIIFRIGVEDAEIIEKEFAPTFNSYDLVNIEAYHAYIKLLIKNQASRPFTIHAFPLENPRHDVAQKIRELSRLKYGRDRAVVEEEILERIKKVEQASGADEPAPIDWKL